MLMEIAGQQRTPARRIGFVAAMGLTIAATFGIATVSTSSVAQAPDEHWVLPRAEFDPSAGSTTETVVLAGGCFWGVQAVYQRINGVSSAVSGYSGGTAETASYRTVLSGGTGHAEAVEIVYNPQIISLGEILRVFFSVVQDPTQLNRQGPDVGPHYRSHIYTTNDQQQQVADAYIAQLDAAGIYRGSIVTKTDPLVAFYPAEAYHQDYLVDNGRNDPGRPNVGYLQYWDWPKLQNTQALFPEYWRSTPVTVAVSRPDLLN